MLKKYIIFYHNTELDNVNTTHYTEDIAKAYLYVLYKNPDKIVTKCNTITI